MSWGCSSDLPLRRLEVMDVDVIALADVGHGLADGLAVLDDRITILDGLQGDLVTDRDGVQRLYLDRLVGFHDPSGQFLAGCNVLGDDDADGVPLVVNDEMGGAHCSSWGELIRRRARKPRHAISLIWARDRKSTRLNSSH